MNPFKIKLMALISYSVLLFSCSDDNDDEISPVNDIPNVNNPSRNIAEVISDDMRMDSLLVALNTTNQTALFQSQGTFTLFAPDNQAFVNLLATNRNWDAITDIPASTLTQLLNYHLINSVIMSSDLVEDSYANTLNTQAPNGENTVIELDVSAGVRLNNNAKVTEADIKATNGVIHLIDQILLPQNVVEMVTNDERFSSLVNALTAYDFGYVSALSDPNENYTVFAPTNDAFTALLNSNSNWNSVNDIDSTTLDGVLTYHILVGRNAQIKNLNEGSKLISMNGDTLEVTFMNGAQLITASSSQDKVDVLDTDIQGKNGVIHAVNEVLLPN